MVELYPTMQEVSLYYYVKNSTPRIKQHLRENIDRFQTLDEMVALAERFETGHKGEP